MILLHEMTGIGNMNMILKKLQQTCCNILNNYNSMRIFLSLVLCSCFYFSFAQTDDDIPDYRSKKDNFLKMQEKDIRADLSQFTFGGIGESLTKHKLYSIP